MISYRISNCLNTLIGRYKQMLCTLETDLLEISGIGKPGLTLDQAVEVIFLIVEFIYQILNGDISKNVPGYNLRSLRIRSSSSSASALWKEKNHTAYLRSGICGITNLL